MNPFYSASYKSLLENTRITYLQSYGWNSEFISSTSQGSGLVRISSGNHSSLLLPTPSAAATVEMQRQMAMFFRTTLAGEPTIVITDSSVVMP